MLPRTRQLKILLVWAGVKLKMDKNPNARQQETDLAKAVVGPNQIIGFEK